jgi:nucleoside-triphosphatase
VKNILLTGKPKSGKSTLLRKLIAKIPNKVGFLVNEILENGNRVGFEMETHLGEKAVIAHVGYEKEQSVGKYGIDINKLNELLPVSFFENEILYLDEIGQMQLQSVQFIELTKKYLNSGNICVATISFVYEHPFILEVKGRDDVTVFEINEDNRDKVYEEILKFLEEKSGI